MKAAMKAAMKTALRLLMVASLVLPFAACKKAEAPAAAVKAPMAAPATDDRQAWGDYLQDVVPRHMGGIVNQPYVYLLPGESAPDFQDQYDRLLEKTTQDVGRGIVEATCWRTAGPHRRRWRT